MTMRHGRTTWRIGAALLPLVAFLVTVAPARAGAARADGGGVTRTVLAPTAIVDARGSHVGSVAALAARDQEGTADDPSKYVRFGGPGVAYAGYRSYTLPGAISPSDVTTITLVANFRGPTASARPWTWSIYDFANHAWVRLGDQNHCGGDVGTGKWPCDDLKRAPWKYVQDNAIHAPGASLADFVSGTGEIRIRLRAAKTHAAKLDYEAVQVYSHAGTLARWTPPVRTRWQWQLQGAKGHFPSTGGINVDICKRSYGSTTCVRPQVFDIDLYVDPSIAGRYGYRIERKAVNAIHASGRHVIGYVTAGDIERWRPDYEQFVDFDRRCGGCLRGNPFSKRFPDEYWANINNDQGQRAFMLQMLRARTDRVAAAGFDGIEYDIVDTWANGERVTGFKVSAQTQLTYNEALATMAHDDGLWVALKNDAAQIPDLLPYFDYAINEQCFQYDECAYPKPGYRAFVRSGKPVFEAEYRIDPSQFCPKANRWDFNSILKAKNYTLYGRPWTPCR
jgi:endo-alpha-1,4-polygalactosaminidase (GH114 family)